MDRDAHIAVDKFLALLEKSSTFVRHVSLASSKIVFSHSGVHCLALGGIDLTSAAGRMTIQVLNAVAEFERDLLFERTQADISRARSEGKSIGRPHSLAKAQQTELHQQLSQGASVASVASLAKQYSTSRQTIMRVRDAK
ncbi:recombinase family protein [Burkholderia multivorans]|uniref:recombinase family protein n=1 Tax=Burkholderia multivorans TaxID=87883 RepID=UPI0022AB1CAE|nr:recombinase family protein [Burkholderia multivorans]